MEKKELEKALDALDEANEDDEVFKVVGPAVIKSNRESLNDNFGEKKESLDVKLSSLEKKESQIQEKAQNLQQELQKTMTGGEEEQAS